MTIGLDRTISKYLQEQLARRGATVTDTTITATDNQLWRLISTYQRNLLSSRGQLTVGGGYRAGAVHFDGSTVLKCSALTASENGFLSFVVWSKISVVPLGVAPPFWVVDPEDTYSSEIWFSNNTFSDPQTYNFKTTIQTSPFVSGIGVTYIGPEEPPAVELSYGVWRCLIVTMQTNLPNGTKIVAGYVNDTPSFYNGTPPSELGDSAAFVPTMNGLPLWVGGDGSINFEGDIADLRLMPGVSLLTGDDISEARRRLFIDENGKPVDPAVATAALGTPGAVLLSGDASTFVTNQGTGGTFTLTGVLTNATTSPSD